MSRELVKNLAGVTPEGIRDAVDDYFVDNPVPGNDVALAEHISDPTPHPAYDNLAAGRFVTYLRNGMS